MILHNFFSGYRKAENKNFDIEKNLPNAKNLNCLERITKKILTLMVNRYNFLHKMDNLFIDLKQKSIFYKINQKREPILKMQNGTVKSYSLDDDSYERLVAILKRKDKNCDDFKDKIVEMESEMKVLVDQIENMKKMLHDISSKLNVY